MTLNLLFILICATVLALSIFRLIKAPVDIRIRIVLITLRVFAVLLLITAFIEPEFVIERLASKNAQVPVLIDVSESMNHFKPDSSVISYLNRLKILENTKKRRFAFYVFGDSLRPLAKEKLTFTDTKSNFPPEFKKLLKESPDLILMSDGNWSNPALQPSIFTETNVHFIPLPKPVRSPFLRLDTKFPEQYRAGNSEIINIRIEGMVPKKCDLMVKIYESGKFLISKNLDIDSGSFDKIIPIQMPDRNPGAYLYRIDAAIPDDSLFAQRFNFQQILPDRFSFAAYSSGQSLDKRFLTLAFNKDSAMIENKKGSDGTDCLLLFNYDSKAEEKIKTVKKTGIIVFAGCLPCSSSFIDNLANSHFLSSKNNTEMVLNENLLENLPAPESIIKPVRDFTKSNCILQLIHKNRTVSDTESMIFTGEFKGKKALTIAAKGFWRCDFWPLSVGGGEEDAFVFSDIIISHIKHILGSNLTNRYFAYPSDISVSSLPLPFHISFPSGMNSGSFQEISFDFFGARHRDTSIQIFNSGALHSQINLFNLLPGFYSYTSTIKSSENFTYSDSILVQPDNSENLVTSQNTTFLKEIGRPLTFDKLDEELSTEKNSTSPVIRETFGISRTWPLLIAIFILFAGEWILRRTKGLD